MGGGYESEEELRNVRVPVNDGKGDERVLYYHLSLLIFPSCYLPSCHLLPRRPLCE